MGGQSSGQPRRRRDLCRREKKVLRTCVERACALPTIEVDRIDWVGRSAQILVLVAHLLRHIPGELLIVWGRVPGSS